MTDDKLERVNMNWPTGLKDRVKEYAGARGLTDFAVGAIERRLQDEDRVVTLEKEVDQLHYLVQLLADRYVIGGDHEDREAFLMEVDLPSWVSTAGWPEQYAKQVQRQHLPVEPVHVPTAPPAPITGVPDPSFDASLDGPSGLSVDDDDQVAEATAPQDDDLHRPMFMTESKEPPTEIQFSGKGGEFFDRVQAAAASKGLDISGAGLKPASALPTPERPVDDESHNHAWLTRTEEGEVACECGAFIQKTDDHPNGIVREADWEDDNEHYVPTEPAPVLEVQTAVATPVAPSRDLDAFEVDF